MNSGQGDSSTPRIVADVATLRHLVREQREAGRTIGLVPTMGALHEGHLSLARRSVAQCDFTVTTIFVNPTQFGPHEDFARYPRTMDADVALLGEHRVDLVFAPAAETMYPPGHSTMVQPPAVAAALEGACRPGHFAGVATVVLKLFHLVEADVAYFGQKDFQQSRVIEDMVRDLDVPVRVHVCPIVREADGLAMSSRNRYLSDAERVRALSLSRALNRAVALVQGGERSARRVCQEMRATLQAADVTDIDYAILADPTTLQELQETSPDAMALIAARVGTTRLIDNCRIGDGPIV